MDAMKFQVTVQTTPGGYVVSLSGELDLGSADMLRHQTEALASDVTTPLTLDMRELAYIDSTGIGVIVALLKMRQASGLGIQVQHVPPKIKRLFDMTGLTRFLTFAASGSAAESGGASSSPPSKEDKV
ncbi:anti-sigma B factor antagonist [Paenibacillus sp. UNCCL117]|uniref:STAS domain-containing protein n=1 Tax=unclassified Paenibacillus TaxID=185978 RepID=UPI00088BBE80|nr:MULTISPECIES: STAS domain-containing protein [unclassified Paenibacillus]SDE07966.1 anti-sigma B factor antagonist [Paenibacillus sp. cl123]SFW59061.1 anti-sigma B factor antagonist [Paenibacillus sp. UNCCL117]